MFLKRKLGLRKPTAVNKLESIWCGPYRVMERVGTTAYKLSLPAKARVHNVKSSIYLREYHATPEKFDIESKAVSKVDFSSTGDYGETVQIEQFDLETTEAGRIGLVFEVAFKREASTNSIWITAPTLVEQTGGWDMLVKFVQKSDLRRKCEALLGRFIRKKFGRHGTFIGFIHEFDLNDLAQTYNIVYPDADHGWLSGPEVEALVLPKSREPKGGKANSVKLDEIHLAEQGNEQPTLKVLNLCAGTDSVGKFFKKKAAKLNLNIDCITVDNDPKFKADFCVDICNWNFKEALQGLTFHIIWCSPPCNCYSKANSVGNPDLLEADRLMRKCQQIIAALQPDIWVIENPESDLQNREVMKPLRRYLHACSYCHYGWNVRKNTHIWTNADEVHLKQCLGQTQCAIKRKTGRHALTAQEGTLSNGTPGIGSGANLYPIPYQLLAVIFPKTLLEALVSRGR